MSNKTLGTAFERKVVSVLKDLGYWVHFIAPDSRGAQPFDIIAVRNGKAIAVECKTLSSASTYFYINRLEENQLMAFDLWEKRGNGIPLIFVEHGKNMAIIGYDTLKAHRRIKIDEYYC